MKVARLYRFHAFHSLPGVPGYDKPHDHDYTVEVVVDGSMKDRDSMIIDTGFLDEVYEPLCREFEGINVNDSVEPSTVENLARWFRTKGPDQLQMRLTVRVWEDNDRWGEAP